MTSLPYRDRLARHMWRLTPQRTLSGFIGWWAAVNVPRGLHGRVLRTFVARYKIDVSEAEHPLAAYRSVNEFFTRKLKPGARPIDPDPSAVVSPADGKIVATGLVSPTGTIEAKNVSLTTGALLTDEALARRFVGGAFQVTYLSPRDYHRVHAPAEGSVTTWHHVPGQLFPVNEATVRREPDLFARNERFVSVFEGNVGTFAVVMVAAVGVGHVTSAYDPEVQTHRNAPAGQVLTKVFATPPRLAKGDEVGIFHLGSTAIVLFEPGRVILEPTAAAKPIRMGERVGQLAR